MEKTFRLLCTFFFILSIPGISQAALVEKDFLEGSGDALLTYDDTTGLEWLDLTLTSGISPDEVSNGYNGYTTAAGFRFATYAEFENLVINNGISQLNDVNADNYYAANILISLLGENYNYSNGYSRATKGYLFNENIYKLSGHGSISIYSAKAWSGDTYGAGAYFGSPNPNSGSYLVRSAVPVPGAILLLGSGLLGLARICRRKEY